MPQVYQVSQISLPAYYDRQPAIQVPTASLTLTPSGPTIRASYSPPATSAAFLEQIFMSLTRGTVAAAAAGGYVRIQYYPSAGGVALMLEIFNLSNVNGTRVSDHQSSFGYIPPGDTVRIETQDDDTGGTFVAFASMKGVEFVRK